MYKLILDHSLHTILLNTKQWQCYKGEFCRHIWRECRKRKSSPGCEIWQWKIYKTYLKTALMYGQSVISIIICLYRRPSKHNQGFLQLALKIYRWELTTYSLNCVSTVKRCRLRGIPRALRSQKVQARQCVLWLLWQCAAGYWNLYKKLTVTFFVCYLFI